jgi:probable rRNA maturation factor
MPALDLTVQGLGRFATLPARATLARWIAAALERDAELVLRFVGASEGRRLNRNFRGRDYATDVLTFDYVQSPRVQADIVICPPAVRRAARERGLPFRWHLAHLVVHATLHAQGYEHGRAAAARKMEAREVEILACLGVGDPYTAVQGS